MNWSVAFMMTAFLTVMLFLDLFKGSFLNEAYHGLRVVPILMLANVFPGIYYNQSVWLSSPTARAGGTIALFGAGVTLLLNFLLIPRIGYLAAPGPPWPATGHDGDEPLAGSALLARALPGDACCCTWP